MYIRENTCSSNLELELIASLKSLERPQDAALLAIE